MDGHEHHPNCPYTNHFRVQFVHGPIDGLDFEVCTLERYMVLCGERLVPVAVQDYEVAKNLRLNPCSGYRALYVLAEGSNMYMHREDRAVEGGKQTQPGASL